MSNEIEHTMPRERGGASASGARPAFFDIATRMARASTDEAAEAIVATLRFAVDTYRLDRAFVRLLADDEARYLLSHEYHRPSLPPLGLPEVPSDSVAWGYDRYVRGEVVVISSLDDIPAGSGGLPRRAGAGRRGRDHRRAGARRAAGRRLRLVTARARRARGRARRSTCSASSAR